MPSATSQAAVRHTRMLSHVHINATLFPTSWSKFLLTLFILVGVTCAFHLRANCVQCAGRVSTGSGCTHGLSHHNEDGAGMQGRRDGLQGGPHHLGGRLAIQTPLLVDCGRHRLPPQAHVSMVRLADQSLRLASGLRKYRAQVAATGPPATLSQQVPNPEASILHTVNTCWNGDLKWQRPRRSIKRGDRGIQ